MTKRCVVKVDGSYTWWDYCHHEKASGDRSRLSCWVGTAGWLNNVTGVSVGGWMVNRNLMFLWRKTKWWITQRSDSIGLLRSPNRLKREGCIIFRVYLFLCWRSWEQNVRAVCQLLGREITNSFLSGVTELGLLLSKENCFTKRSH